MDYFINPKKLSAVFSVPSAVVDKHLKLANEKQLKCLLVFLRNISDGCDENFIANALNIPVSEAADALSFWKDAGLLLSDSETKPSDKKENSFKGAKISQHLPTREETIERSKNSKTLQFIFREAQLKFGRPLKQSETSLLVWLNEDLGMDASLILMLLQYAKSENNCNVRYIEKTACEWVDAGITDIKSAEEKINELSRQNICWKAVVRVFELPYRMPSKKERELSSLWIDKWKMSPEMLKKAYEECVDNTSKISMPYISKVLEKWHKAGIKDVKSIPANNENKSKKSDASYDINLVKNLLNGD